MLICRSFVKIEAIFHLSLASKVVTGMVPILINKDVFEPSYNDLKFMVQNHH